LITTARLTLRRLIPADAPTMYAYRAMPEVARYQGWVPATLEAVESFISEQQAVVPDTPDTWCQLAITITATGEMIGDLGLHFLDAESRTVELGITLHPDHQGRGHAAEAMQAAFDYLFGTLGKHRIYGSTDPRNQASLALQRRAGMRQEAHLVESLRFKGEWADDVICAILEREWRAGASSPSKPL